MTEFQNVARSLGDHLHLHSEDIWVLSNICDHIDQCKVAVGCLMGGSRSMGVGNENSDVDLFFHCATGIQEYNILSCILQLSKFKGVCGVVPQGKLPWFGRCFTVISREWRFSIDLGFVLNDEAPTFFWEPTGTIIWDANGCITAGVKYWANNFASYPFRIRDPFSRGITAIYKGMKSVERRELYNAIELCGHARRAVTVLLRHSIGGSADMYYGRAERRIENILDQNTLSRLHQTLPVSTLESVRECLTALANWLIDIGNSIEFTSESECNSHRLLKDMVHRM